MTRIHGIEVELKQFRVTTTITLDRRILNEACVVLEQTTSGRSQVIAGPWYENGPGRVVRIAAGLAVAAAVVLVALVLWNPTGEEPQPKPSPGPDAPGGVATVEQRLARERNEIETMSIARDVGGLIAMLETGLRPSQRLAADSLGRIGDGRALPALSRLAEKWQGDPTDNPFARAIEQITSRMENTEPNAPDTNESPTSQIIPQVAPAPVLSGTITDMDLGQPLEGVLIQVVPDGGGRLYEATTDSNGLYSLDAVGNDGAYELWLVAPEHFAPADWERPRETIELRRGQPAVKDFALSKGAAILAKIVDETGQPVRRARLFASYVSDEWGKGPKRPIRSDDDGIASLGGLRADEYWVTVAHPDYALAGRPVVLEEPGQVESPIFVLEKGIQVVGVATCSDGLPAAGWRIEAKPQWWHSVYSWPGKERVAEDGTFVLPHIVPGVYRLEVYIPVDGGARGIWSTDVNLPPETGVLDFQIPKSSPHFRVSLSGTVVFTEGDYKRSFWVHADSIEGHHAGVSLGPGERQFVLTDLVPGLYDLNITIEGQRHDFKNIEAPGEGVVLEVRIRTTVQVRATVVDKETGQPIRRFRFRSAGGDQWHQMDDPQGFFEVTARGSDSVSVVVQADGYGDAAAVLSADANEPTVVEMSAPLVLSGKVVDEMGQPVEGAMVSFRHRRSRDESPEGKEITATDAKGQFTVPDVPLSDTYHWFVFHHPDYARSMRCIEMAEQGVTETQIVLKKGGAIEGIVYDWQGRPLPETDVYFMDESHFPYWKENRARLGTVTTDGNGYYRIEHLPEELCYAFREDPDNQLGVVLSMILPCAGQTRRLDMGGPWKTSGRLVRAGEPVANIKLLVTYQVGVAQGFKAYAVSDALGRFSFYGLPTGRRPIYWAVPGGKDWNRWIELATVDFDRDTTLDFSDLEIVVADVTVDLVFADESIPVDRWDVQLYEAAARGSLSRQVGQLKSRLNHSDPFVFSGIGAGDYTVVVSREGYPTLRDRLRVEPGQLHSATAVTVPSGAGRLSGQIVSSEEGEPWPLWLQSADGRIEMSVTPGADGAFEVDHLPAGEYCLSHSRLAPPLARVHLGAGGHETVRIQVNPVDDHGYLVVLIVTPEGLPLATSDVWLERRGQIIEPHFNTDDGKSFAGAPGTYALCAHYPGFRPVRQTVELKSREGRTIQAVLEPLVITMRRE